MITSSPPQNNNTKEAFPHLVWPVLLVSVAVLAFEISLMRMLLVASFHHFAFLVISIALLGFGASGTVLMILRDWVLKRANGVLLILVSATGASMPICSQWAQHVPVEARFLPALFWSQIGSWILYWLVLTIPFLLGASMIGLALMVTRDRQGAVYGANLIGSGVGAILATLIMWIVPPSWLPLVCAIPTCFATLALRNVSAVARVVAAAITIVIVAAYLGIDAPHIRPEPYKYSAHVQRLVEQDSAKRLATAYSPRALLQIYRGEVFHDLPFLSGSGAAPPPLDVILRDGHQAGSVLRIADIEQAAVVDQTMMAFPYRVVPDLPRVLLLGEMGGSNIWLAARRGASTIDVVQPDRKVVAILRSRAKSDYGNVFNQPGVHLVTAEPRHFLEHTDQQYDLIQLVTLEGMSVGGGMGGLGQDHLITVQGIAACLRRLSSEGALTVCRGIQDPPRDNVKLLATFVAALERLGQHEPQRHIVIVRDFLAVCTIVKRSPWGPNRIARVQQEIVEHNLTPVWFTGIDAEQLNQPDELPGPSDGVGDWLHHAAVALFSSAAARFIDQWQFDIRPPTDDRPFFRDFCKLRAIPAMKAAFGDLWLTRADLAFLFVLGAMIIIAVLGAALTLLPLLLIRKRPHAGKAVTAGYFTAIGLAYLMLEMTLISRAIHLIGDPTLAAAVTISAFLVFSGIGSLLAQSARRRDSALPFVIVVLIGVGIAELMFLIPLAAEAGVLAPIWRCVVAVMTFSPLAMLMGFPMPSALIRLDRGEPSLIPWAWGLNGFASVFAAPLATVIGMTWGFGIAGAAALALYAMAAVLFFWLPGQR